MLVTRFFLTFPKKIQVILSQVKSNDLILKKKILSQVPDLTLTLTYAQV